MTRYLDGCVCREVLAGTPREDPEGGESGGHQRLAVISSADCLC